MRLASADTTREAAKHDLDAEDAGEELHRYAAYSTWVRVLPSLSEFVCPVLMSEEHPLETVPRDPLAACDWRTVNQDELYDTEYRNPADNKKGEFMNTIRMLIPPQSPAQQRWYY